MISNGGRIAGNLSGFGTLGFGENTIKWLEAEKVIPHPLLINGGGASDLQHDIIPQNNKAFNKEATPGNNNDGKFEVRYEVCKSTKKF